MIKIFRFNSISDLNLSHIFECGQCFRWEEANGSYIGIAGASIAKVSYDNKTLTVEASGGDEAFWRNYFDLNNDYGEIKKTISKLDFKIDKAIEYGYGIRILNQDLFETMISFIISQNNNIPRIKKCIESLCKEYGKPLGTEFGKEWYAFPDAKTLAAAKLEDLNALKLGYRSEYIIETAKRFIQIGEPKTYEEILSFHGIGPKVANCIMLFGLHETASFPVDTWVKYIMNDMYGFEESDTKGMMHFAEENFGKYAGYAQQYLFYYYREKGKNEVPKS